MLKFIVAAECEIKFNSPTAPDERTAKYSVPPGRLATIRDHLAAYAVAQFGARPADAVAAPVADDDYYWLRQHCLHLSWRNSPGMEMRVNDDAYRLAKQQEEEWQKTMAEADARWAAEAAARNDSTAAPVAAAPPPAAALPPPAPRPDDNYRPVRWVIHG